LINLRGQIVTLLDLRYPLGYPQKEDHNGSLIILKTNQELSQIAIDMNLKTYVDPVGFLVDSIGNVITCDEDEISPVPANADPQLAEHLTGVISKKDLLLGIVNLNKLFKN